MSPAATRRSERRLATVAEIKAAAWADIVESGTTDCSWRGVARRLGMAPSALYRYFPGRDALLTALIVDAFDDLAQTLRTAFQESRAAVRVDQPGELFVAVAGCYRTWALSDPLRYRLIFGNPVGGYVGTSETTAASQRSTVVLLEIMTEYVDDGLLAPGLDPTAPQGFTAWSAELPTPLPPEALAAAITCYAALHGAIGLEINHHLPPSLVGDEQVYRDTMRHVVSSILR